MSIKTCVCPDCFEIIVDDAMFIHHGICSRCDAAAERRYLEEERCDNGAFAEMDAAFDALCREE